MFEAIQLIMDNPVYYGLLAGIVATFGIMSAILGLVLVKLGLASCHCCPQPRSSAIVLENQLAQAEELCCSQMKLVLASMPKGFAMC